MKWKVKSVYKSRGTVYLPGTIEVDEDEARFLLVDSPGTFEVVKPRKKPKARQMTHPPMDKMMKEPAEAK